MRIYASILILSMSTFFVSLFQKNLKIIFLKDVRKNKTDLEKFKQEGCLIYSEILAIEKDSILAFPKQIPKKLGYFQPVLNVYRPKYQNTTLKNFRF